MRDIGAIIWGILVVIGVVSSIVQSARRARGARGVPAPLNSQVNRSAGTPARANTTVAQPQANVPPQLAALMRQFEQQAQPVAQAAAPPPPAPEAPAAPKAAPSPPPAVAVHPVAAPRRGRGGIAAFADRESLVRAIVGAEVLGKPLALRDE